MSAHLFQLRCNSLRLRYKRAVINAQRKRLSNLRAISKITGREQLVPAHLRHLQ